MFVYSLGGNEATEQQQRQREVDFLAAKEEMERVVEPRPRERTQQDYDLVLRQARELLDDQADVIANMANVAALLHSTFHFWWTGFYRVVDSHLVLGPFQGPMACTRIALGHGVCGTAWQQAHTILVPDVEQFPGHIACSSNSRSEIVVPLLDDNGQVTAVLDIDSQYPAHFSDLDARNLERLAEMMSGRQPDR